MRSVVTVTLAVVLIGGALAAGSWYLSGAPRPSSAPAPDKTTVCIVRRQTFQRQLYLLGFVQAKDVVPVYSRYHGTVKWKIPEGTRVEKDTVIVRFDAAGDQDNLEAKERDLVINQAELDEALLELAVRQKRKAALIWRVELELALAQHNRDELYRQPYAPDQQLAELDLELARLRFLGADAEWRRASELLELGVVSNLAVKQKALERAGKSAEYEKQKVLHRLALAGPTRDQQRLAELEAKEKQLALAQTKFNTASEIRVSESNLKVVRQRYENAQEEKETIRQRITQAQVRAPSAGRVAYVEIWKGAGETAPLQVGDNLSSGALLCKIADTTTLSVEALLNEVDLGRVKVGARAKITLPALPGKSFAGQVSRLGMFAEDKNTTLGLARLKYGEAFVRVVTVHVDFDSLPEAIRRQLHLGFSAELELESGESRQALVVPVAAVRAVSDGSGGEAATPGARWGEVRLLERGKTRTVRVKLGETGAFQQEVREGLREGDAVLVGGAW